MRSTEYEYARDLVHSLRLGLEAYVKTDMHMRDTFFKGISMTLDLINEEGLREIDHEGEAGEFSDLVIELSDDIAYYEKKSKKERL